MQMNDQTKKILLCMLGALLAVCIVCVMIIPNNYQKLVLMPIMVCWGTILYLRVKKSKPDEQKPRKMQVIDLEPDYKNLFTQQMQYRIQEKIRSKFPAATIELSESDIERIVKTGKAVYIPIKKADDYCHISIAMKNNGDILLNLFSLVNLEQVKQGTIKQMAEDQHKAVDQWYTQRGQELLTELITNMNSRGHSKLIINESGDVLVKENGRNVLKDRFEEIPPKDQWDRLKELMTEDDLDVQVSSRRLTIAW